MAYTLGTAAKATGRNKTTILRAIKDGKVAALRDTASGAWRIEPVELHRVYPAVAEATPDATARDPDAMVELRARLADAQATIDDLRRQRDADAEERRRLTALLADKSTLPRRSWWPWRR